MTRSAVVEKRLDSRCWYAPLIGLFVCAAALGASGSIVVNGNGNHTCRATITTSDGITITDEVECASNESCGAKRNGDTVRALCVRQQ